MLPSWNPIVAVDVRRLDEEFPVPRSQFPDHLVSYLPDRSRRREEAVEGVSSLKIQV